MRWLTYLLPIELHNIVLDVIPPLLDTHIRHIFMDLGPMEFRHVRVAKTSHISHLSQNRGWESIVLARIGHV